jgi:hypothetical protein
MSRKAVKRRASAEHATKVWKELRNVPAVARRLGYSVEGTYRLLNRLSLRKYAR